MEPDLYSIHDGDLYVGGGLFIVRHSLEWKICLTASKHPLVSKNCSDPMVNSYMLNSLRSSPAMKYISEKLGEQYYIPSVREMTHIFKNRYEINEFDDFYFHSSAYWTSTPDKYNKFYSVSQDGLRIVEHPKEYNIVRPVRRISI